MRVMVFVFFFCVVLIGHPDDMVGYGSPNDVPATGSNLVGLTDKSRTFLYDGTLVLLSEIVSVSPVRENSVGGVSSQGGVLLKDFRHIDWRYTIRLHGDELVMSDVDRKKLERSRFKLLKEMGMK